MGREKSQDIRNEGRVDNFEGPGEMQRRRRSLSKAGRSRDTSRARETITSAINAKENKKSKASGTRSSSRGREMVVERKEERRERGRSRAKDLQVPMTLRQPFLDDPFFKGTLKSLESTRDDFFKQARQSFEESLKQMETRPPPLSPTSTMPPAMSLLTTPLLLFPTFMMPLVMLLTTPPPLLSPTFMTPPATLPLPTFMRSPSLPPWPSPPLPSPTPPTLTPTVPTPTWLPALLPPRLR